MALSRDKYLKQQNDYNKITYNNEYDQKQRALQQAYERNKLSFNNQRTDLQNAYTQGRNQLNELRNQSQADYTKGQNAINETRAAQQPLYQQSRNSADVTAAQAGRRLSEILANTGRERSGTFNTGMAGVQNQRNATIADVNQSENLFNAQLNNRLAEIEQQRANSLGSIGNRAAELEQQYYGDLSGLNQQSTLYDTQYNDQRAAYQNQLAEQLRAAQLLANMQYEDYAQQQMANDLSLAGFAWGNLSDYAAQTDNGFSIPSGYKPGDFLTEFYKKYYKG